MSDKWKIAYVSTISCSSDHAIQGILDQSRANNARTGITGVLLRDSKSYFQYLEGPRQALGACLLTIAGDPRHHDVTMLLSMPTQVLFFDGWSLADATLPQRRRSLSSFARLLRESDAKSRQALIEQTCLDAIRV